MIAVVLLAAGCAGVPPPPQTLEDLLGPEVSSTPPDPDAARSYLQSGDADWAGREVITSVESARLAYWRAALSDPDLLEAYWKAARASILLGEEATKKLERVDAFRQGLQIARLAIDRDASLPEPHYYYALNLGLLAREHPSRGTASIREMIPHLETAAEADPGLDHGGPLRTLALVYLRAPGWPVSVGDEKASLDYAHQAVEEAPDYPGNHLALAEALHAGGEKDGCRDALAKARRLISSGPWSDRERRGFQEEAESLDCKLGD